MDTKLFLTTSYGETIINSLVDSKCLQCITNCKLNHTICPHDNIKHHVKFINDEKGQLYVCDNKEKTTKNFLTLVELLIHCRPSLIKLHNETKREIQLTLRKEIETFKHNIVHINTEALNEFYYFIGGEEELVKKYKKIQELTKEAIKKNPHGAVDLISRIGKYNLNIKTELSVDSKLNNPDSSPNFDVNNPRDAIMSNVYMLYPMFRENGIYINVNEFWEKFYIDYDALQVASFYIIENAIKYSEKGSTVNIDFIKELDKLRIEFSMRSLYIDEGVEKSLFVEGFQGEQAKISGKGGKGIGLYRTKRLLDFVGGEIELQAGAGKEEGTDGLFYSNNIFTFILPIFTISPSFIESLAKPIHNIE